MKSISISSMLRAEFYKSKRNKGFLLMILFPLFIILCSDLYIIYHADEAYKSPITPWATYLARYTLTYISFFYPIIISLFCYSVCDMEYKNNSFKQLFSLPISRSNLYIAKVVFMFMTLFAALLLAYTFFFLSGYLLQYIVPQYGFDTMGAMFLEQFNKYCLISTSGFIAVLMIQFFLSLMFRNFLIPIGIGGFGVIFGLIAKIWDYIEYVPHATAMNALFSVIENLSTSIAWNKTYGINLSYTIVFMVIAWVFFTRRLGKNNK